MVAFTRDFSDASSVTSSAVTPSPHPASSHPLASFEAPLESPAVEKSQKLSPLPVAASHPLASFEASSLSREVAGVGDGGGSMHLPVHTAAANSEHVASGLLGSREKLVSGVGGEVERAIDDTQTPAGRGADGEVARIGERHLGDGGLGDGGLGDGGLGMGRREVGAVLVGGKRESEGGGIVEREELGERASGGRELGEGRMATNGSVDVAAAQTDMGELMERVAQETAVKEFLASKVRGLEAELDAERRKLRAEVAREVREERERQLAAQWQAEEDRAALGEARESVGRLEKEKAELQQQLQTATEEHLKAQQDKAAELAAVRAAEAQARAEAKLLAREVKQLRQAVAEAERKRRAAEERAAELEAQQEAHSGAVSAWQSKAERFLHEISVC
ncbi:unnamed protein product [Closterium sp. Naga37s-1]|nr:unnamed protein product [Closterium sp. Naga37s-1]